MHMAEKQLNPEHIDALIELINRGPFLRLLSMQVCELRRGFCRMETELEEKHLNPFGGLHGGVYSALIDSAAYWAAYCDLEEGTGLVSLDLKVDNLAGVKNGRLLVEGTRIKTGRSICLAEACVKDSEGKILAHGTSKLMVTPGVQSIDHAVAAMGFAALPPKFLP